MQLHLHRVDGHGRDRSLRRRQLCADRQAWQRQHNWNQLFYHELEVAISGASLLALFRHIVN